MEHQKDYWAGSNGITSPTSRVINVNLLCKYKWWLCYVCFCGKKGYSNFGTYTGNGNADGTFCLHRI